MNHLYHGLIDKSRFALTDFNCTSFNQQLGEGDYYRVIWAKERNILIEINGRQISLKKNHLLFCTPLNRAKIESNTNGIIYCAFSKEFYCMKDHMKKGSSNNYLFRGTFVPSLIKLSEVQQHKFDFLFTLFKEEFERKDHFQGEMLMVLLKRLLIMFNRIALKNIPKQQSINRKPGIVEEFNYLVEIHFREKHKVSDYAEILHKSPKTISNSFLKYSKKTPHKVIKDRICLEAQKLLLSTNKTISEIAYDLEFTEVSHFSKYFKKHIGYSPKAYKQSRQRLDFDHLVV